jgi:phosphoenolpyruvate-protein phosphotransferase/dihydroxyacetone kinase phosphotransfer subunit
VVGIVIVSHSRQLAEGVRELAAQMVQGKVTLAVAAGIDDPEYPLGTDATKIYEAIASVYTEEGVIVLMDLGSALMNAEMALEFFPEEHRHHVYLCEAPLVEGVFAAAVAAASGRNIEQVIAEARGALVAKATQLGVVALDVLSSQQPVVRERQQAKEIRVIVRNPLGLHARPAAQFVSTAARFQSQITVQNLTKGTEPVRADSINQVTTLGVRQGHELVISATGADADAALASLLSLVESHFGETNISVPPSFPPPVSSSSHHNLRGIPACPGVAIAPIVLYHSDTLTIQQYHVDDVDTEWQRLQNALQVALREVQTLLSHTSTQIGDAEAAIFDAHMLFLEDPVLIEAAQQHIFEHHLNAEAAWQAVIDELANRYQSLEDSYLQERAADVVDVGQRVLRVLFQSASVISDHYHPDIIHQFEQHGDLNLSQPAILVASDLTPSDTARLDPTKVLGICTTSGSPTSHSAILARSLGIPEVVGLPAEILHLAESTLVALDGETGEVWIEPEPDILAVLEAKRDAWQAAQQQALALAQQSTMTQDGQPSICVYANLNNIENARFALTQGAEGVGLLRTEFLYLQRADAPTEEEQLRTYQAIAQVLETRPLIIRTLDIGGDKPLPYLGLQSEANPFLGWRGIRFCLARPDIFKTQLRAILRASMEHEIKLMFPMIATVEEVQAAKAILGEVKAELNLAGIAFNEKMEVGMMVEVPSAVMLAEELAKEVDFFSIGTNDLSQYVMACDRTNPQVATLADALHPAVLRMIQQTVQAGHKAGIKVGLCGEIAADPLAPPILLGLGLDTVSLSPHAIPAFKQAIFQLTVAQAEAIAQSALEQDSAAKVRAVVSNAVTPHHHEQSG